VHQAADTDRWLARIFKITTWCVDTLDTVAYIATQVARVTRRLCREPGHLTCHQRGAPGADHCVHPGLFRVELLGPLLEEVLAYHRLGHVSGLVVHMELHEVR